MFVGLNVETGELVTTGDIDPRSDPVGHDPPVGLPTHDPFEVWFRDRCHAKHIICDGCKTSLVFRRGRVITAHLAHEAKASACSYARKEKPLHLCAAVTFYRWMKEKLEGSGRFPGWKAQMEVRLQSEEIRRPLDVQLLRPDGDGGFGYLLVSRRFSWEERDAWDEVGRVAGRSLHRVGVDRRFKLHVDHTALEAGVLPPSGQRLQVELAKQELWAVVPSRHAAAWHRSTGSGRWSGGVRDPTLGGAVDFLVPTREDPLPIPEHWEVVSFRLPSPRPNAFSHAVLLRHPLVEMLVRPSDGALLHPGEHEELAGLEREKAEAAKREQRQELERLEAKAKEAAARAAAKGARLAERVKPARRQPDPVGPVDPTPALTPAPAPVPARPSPEEAGHDGRVARCVYCDTMTSDLWMYDPVTVTGKCRPCLEAKRRSRS